MVNTKICDACYAKDKAMIRATNRIGFKGDKKLDLCEECAKTTPREKRAFYKYYTTIMGEEPTETQLDNLMKF